MFISSYSYTVFTHIKSLFMDPPLPRKTGILDIVKRLYEQKKKKQQMMINNNELSLLLIEKQPDNTDNITQQFSISETTSYESNTTLCDMSIDSSPSHSIEEDEELKSPYKKRSLSPPPSLQLQLQTTDTLDVEEEEEDECNAICIIDDKQETTKSLKTTKRKEDDINRRPKKIGSPIKKRSREKEKKQKKTRKQQKVIYKPSVYITYKINRKGKKPNHVVYLVDYYMDTKSRVIWIVEDYKNSDKTWNERQDNIICNTLNK